MIYKEEMKEYSRKYKNTKLLIEKAQTNDEKKLLMKKAELYLELMDVCERLHDYNEKEQNESEMIEEIKELFACCNLPELDVSAISVTEEKRLIYQEDYKKIIKNIHYIFYSENNVIKYFGDLNKGRERLKDYGSLVIKLYAPFLDNLEKTR